MPKMWMEVICLHTWMRSNQIVAQEPDEDRAQTRYLDLISDKD